MSIDNDQIPVSAYINFHLLYEIEQEIESSSELKLNAIVEKTSTRIGAEPPLSHFYRPMNAGSLFCFLYATLVVPKELTSIDYFNEFDFKISETFQLTPEFQYSDYATNVFGSLDIFRVIRNAISHANFSVLENSKIRMWNNNQHGVKNFEVTTDVNRLTNFALSVAEYCIAKRNSINDD